MTTLAGAGFHAIALDLPPFGFSQRPANARYDKQSQGKRILGVIDGLSLNSVVLVGHSFGGLILERALSVCRQRSLEIRGSEGACLGSARTTEQHQGA